MRRTNKSPVKQASRLISSVMIVMLLAGLLPAPIPGSVDRATASPIPIEQQGDLSTQPITITGTLSVPPNNPYKSAQHTIYHMGAAPALVEVELLMDSSAVGGLSLTLEQSENDGSGSRLYVPLAPSGGRYVATGYILPGHNVIDLFPRLLGGGLSDIGYEPYVTGDLPYTITIRPVEPLPVEGLTLDMGAYSVEQAYLGSNEMASARRFTLAQPGLFAVLAPSLAGHTNVTLSRMEGAYPDEATEEVLRASLVAGQKVPLYLTAGNWEMTVIQTKPGPAEEPLPAAPGAFLFPSVSLTPWTSGDGPTDGVWEIVTSKGFQLKVPSDMAGEHLITVTTSTYGANLSIDWWSRSFPAGAVETFVKTLGEGGDFSFYGSEATREGYRVAIKSLQQVGEEPLTLQGTVRVEDAESDVQLSDLNVQMPRAGWYPLQAKTSAGKASFTWGSLTFPVHGTNADGSAPAPMLPISFGAPGMTLYPGAPLQATWQIDVGKGQPYPGRTVVLEGQLLPGETVQVPLPLGIRKETNVDLQVVLDGPAGSRANFHLGCGELYALDCVYWPVFGTDNPGTEDDERVYSNRLEKLYSDSGHIKLARADSLPGPLSYTVSITLPEISEVVITKMDGSGSAKVDGAGPIEVPLGEMIQLDARDLDMGLDQNLNVLGRSLNVQWSVVSNGGQASIDQWGHLVAQSAGDVTVTASYEDEPGISPATRIVRIAGAAPPKVNAYAGIDWMKPGKWIMSGDASVAAPKRVTRLEVRLAGTGEWLNLTAPIAVNIGQSTASFSVDPEVLFPGLPQGRYTFELRATDSAGGVGTHSASFLLDHTKPVVTAMEARQSEDGSGPIVAAPGPLDVSEPISFMGEATDMAGEHAGGLARVEFAYRRRERPSGTRSVLLGLIQKHRYSTRSSGMRRICLQVIMKLGLSPSI